MNTLAHGFAYGDGPGPWILLFPLMWALVVGGAVFLLRRGGWRGRAPWRQGPVDFGERSPIAVLGRRFAAGEIDEDEYWRRLSVLDERFGHQAKGGVL
ncbi:MULTISPECIES: SHOCT domain-containing protein [Streptomyces]|uniref:SHOCT domain-containing protein n=1 Tax=Streptomyces TaxID=1883 RepID=UPI000F7A583A|nr:MULTISPECIES: SHOCT domain-containing protein [unclassified Streptomyces]AJZ84763.1 SHOCT domain-containing protein [Streptomyces sp. AgN23]RSS35753.1 SHOCT domain-containing protein [Streptomyces sp. WAC05858]WTA79725.1 SHOCT domain-containing protein [Streptomyces antimycoticus]WTB10094.1 SHOCT domain-containing protein [Streptomyces antimycoticus]